MELDELVEARQFIKELFDKEVKAGNIPSSMSYSEWLESLRTKLNAGGPVSKAKIKEPKSVKKIDLAQELLKTADLYSRLWASERETLNWLLKKTLGKK